MAESEILTDPHQMLLRALAAKDAEIERLKHGLALLNAQTQTIRGLRAENERLNETIAEWQRIHGTFAPSGAPDDIHFACRTEIERLRETQAEDERRVRDFASGIIAQALENTRLRAVEAAARAYCGVPIDDGDAGALYRALCEALRRPDRDE